LLQNEVLSSLRRAPPDYYALHVSPEVRKWYLAKFELVREPYTETDDIWFRYASSKDVTAWANFLVAAAPVVIETFERVA
jgi:hypothetical protein